MSSRCVVDTYYDVEHDYHAHKEGRDKIQVTSAMFLGVEMIERLPRDHIAQIQDQLLTDHVWFDGAERKMFYAKVRTDLEVDSKLDQPIYGRSRNNGQ